MPGKNHKFTPKQDRQAEHIADSEMKAGKKAAKAKSIGYATVNKLKSGKKSYTKENLKMAKRMGVNLPK